LAIAAFLAAGASAQEVPYWMDNGWSLGLEAQYSQELPGETFSKETSRIITGHTQFIRRMRTKDSWFQRIEIVNDLSAGLATTPEPSLLAGYAAIARFHFRPVGRLKRMTVFGGVGGGFNYFGPHKNLSRVTGAFQFSAIAEGGVAYYPKRWPNAAIVGGYRSWHYSNLASLLWTPRPNRGINTHTAFVGVNYRFGGKKD